MTRHSYRYTFGPEVPLPEAEASLVVALLAAQSLHGEVQVRLDARHAFDYQQRACLIDASTVVGNDLNRLFAGFLAREFDPSAYSVERIEGALKPEPGAVAATA